MAAAERRRQGVLAVLLLLALGLSGCASGSTAQRAPADAAVRPSGAAGRPSGPSLQGWQGVRYVALGDSYTAAPYVPVTDLAGGCLRSSGNYPSLVAERLATRVRDVSCSGADTGDVTGAQPAPNGTAQPPQIRAVTAVTGLVTVGIGGNDDRLFATLLDACLRPSDQAGRPQQPCANRVESALGDPASVVDRTGRRVATVLRRVQRRAPRAVVVLVGYPRLVSPDRSCAAVPLPAEDRTFLAGLESDLAAALAAAARSSGTRYVDMYRRSAGHALCSPDPWVNGGVTDRERALAFHPFAAEQRAVAAAVLDQLRQG